MDPTGDDGLTEGERAEVDADTAAAAAKEAGAAGDDGKDEVAAGEAGAADGAAAADADAEEKVETKVDPGIAALAAVADKLSKVGDQLAEAAKPKAVVEEVKTRDFDAEKRDLKALLEKGEIDEDAYEERREKILEEAADARAERRINERLEADAKQRAEQSWENDVKRFAKDPDSAKLYDDEVRNAAFNRLVHIVARENPHGTNEQWLTEARKRTYDTFGIGKAAAPLDAAAKKKLEEEQRKRDAAAGKKPNPSIADAPAAGGDAGSDIPDAHARLDKLPVSDLEDLLARMPEDKVNDYLSQAPGGLKDNPKAVH
jgi:hypothetical protein